MKNIAKMFLVLLMVMFVSACGNSGGESDIDASGVKMYMIVSVTDTFRSTLMEQAEKTAKELGASITFVDSENVLENQLAQIDEAVSQKYDVIICNPVDVDTTLQLQVAAGDIPMVFWNSCPDASRLEAGKYVYVGSNEEDAGTFQAEYILDKFSDKEEINVAVLMGQKLHSATLGRTNALKYSLKQSGKKINYVFADFADWDQAAAKEQMDLFLRTGQEFDCVACNNDSMALGVIESMKEHNIDFDKVPVLGVDATADGCAAIEAGEMSFTVYQSAVGQGEYAVKAAALLAKGESLKTLKYVSEDEKHVWVPFERVDKNNYKDYE